MTPSRAMRSISFGASMLVACGGGRAPAGDREPAATPQPRLDQARLDTASVAPVSIDAAVADEPPRAQLARWRSSPVDVGPRSPACIDRPDRFVQYADLDGHGDPRFCLWWNLQRDGAPDAACWRVELATGTYVREGGVWFSAPQPLRVGIGGPAWSRAADWSAHWKDDVVELCRGATCQQVPIPHAADTYDDEIAIDAPVGLSVIPLGRAPGAAHAHQFATVDLATGARLATLTIPDRHGGARLGGFVGPSVFVTDCDDRATGSCTWEIYDPRHGNRVAVVGGNHPLGAGGSAVPLDGPRFAAVAGSRLVVQDATTGLVSAAIALPRVLAADYIVLGSADKLVVPGPDGRIVVVDPVAGKVTRTILPSPCPR